MRAYRVDVPSRGRAEWLYRSTRKTCDFLRGVPNTRLWVRADDPDKTTYRYYAESRDIRVVEYDASKILGAAQTYDALINDAIECHYEVLIVLDDDLRFTTPNPILGAKPMFVFLDRVGLMKEMLDQASSVVCEEMPLITFTPVMNRSHPTLFNFCAPIMMAYVLYLPHFRAHPEHRFWYGEEIEARCDLNLSLMLLTGGWLTAFLCTVLIPDNVNNPGGCSIYRDLEFEKASVTYLKRRYPTLVKTRPKRGWAGDPDVVREAPIISWKRAINKELFYSNHGVSVSDWAYNVKLKEYEDVYSKFIRRYRLAHSNTEQE